MDNLVCWHPKDILVLHGPTKLLVNKYHWHSPQAGIVASYTPTKRDVQDHFGLFRGVDQVESFAQAATGSCSVFLECEKQGLGPLELAEKFLPRFVSIGKVIFHNYLEKGDTFVNIGHIKFYKFRQMICDGRIYKAPKGLDLDEYFSSFNDERLLNYDVSNDFTLVADLSDVICRAIKSELFNKQFEQ
ncbi:MAG TPA: hypothetical protein VGI43_18425 [Mucilaginibacter sp.]